jgi:hypothetical protein
MSTSSLSLTRSTDAIFECDGAFVTVYFAINGEKINGLFKFTRAEAVFQGSNIASTGEWDLFPIDKFPVDALRSFGARLNTYGVTGN